eukprot:3143296-Amphidinium_carterae.1
MRPQHSGTRLNPCQRAFYRHALRTEAALAQGRNLACLFVDVSKAFDHIQHGVALQAARKHDFNLLHWNTARSLYAGDRVVTPKTPQNPPNPKILK